MFSVGSVIGALLGAAAFAMGSGVLATAIAIGLLALTLCAVAAPTLMRRSNSYAAVPCTPKLIPSTLQDQNSVGPWSYWAPWFSFFC